VQVLLFMKFVLEDHDVLFILSEACHLIGLAILLWKLHQKKSAAGATCDLPEPPACLLALA
jgi:ER lumen protein retaining receptor